MIYGTQPTTHSNNTYAIMESTAKSSFTVSWSIMKYFASNFSVDFAVSLFYGNFGWMLEF